MRWPFMLVSTHEALMQAKNEQLSLLTAERVIAIEHGDDMTEKYVALAASLADRATQPVAVAPRPRREPDAVDTAIDFVAQGDIPKRRYLERWAKGQRRAGVEPDAIAHEILHPRVSDDAEEGAPV